MPTTTQSTQDAMYRKVRALLDTAESYAKAGNLDAADSYNAKAMALIERHRLDEARLHPNTDNFTGTRFPLHQFSYLRASLALLNAIAKHYGVVTVIGATGNSKNPGMFGDADDILATVTMFQSLVIQRDTACLASTPPPGVHRTKHNNSFAYGYAIRISQRLAEIRTAAVEDAQTASDSTALELFDRHKDTMARLEGKVSKANQNRPSVNRAGLDAGEEAADRADLGQTRVGNTGPAAIGTGR